MSDHAMYVMWLRSIAGPITAQRLATWCGPTYLLPIEPRDFALVRARQLAALLIAGDYAALERDAIRA